METLQPPRSAGHLGYAAGREYFVRRTGTGLAAVSAAAASPIHPELGVRCGWRSECLLFVWPLRAGELGIEDRTAAALAEIGATPEPPPPPVQQPAPAREAAPRQLRLCQAREDCQREAADDLPFCRECARHLTAFLRQKLRRRAPAVRKPSSTYLRHLKQAQGHIESSASGRAAAPATAATTTPNSRDGSRHAEDSQRHRTERADRRALPPEPEPREDRRGVRAQPHPHQPDRT